MSAAVRAALLEMQARGDAPWSTHIARTIKRIERDGLAEWMWDLGWVVTPKGTAALYCSQHTDCLASPELARACWESRR